MSPGDRIIIGHAIDASMVILDMILMVRLVTKARDGRVTMLDITWLAFCVCITISLALQWS